SSTAATAALSWLARSATSRAATASTSAQITATAHSTAASRVPKVWATEVLGEEASGRLVVALVRAGQALVAAAFCGAAVFGVASFFSSAPGFCSAAISAAVRTPGGRAAGGGTRGPSVAAVDAVDAVDSAGAGRRRPKRLLRTGSSGWG